MKKLTLVFTILFAVTASAQTTVLRSKYMGWEAPYTGNTLTITKWRVDVDQEAWWSASAPQCISPNVSGSYSLELVVQWSLGNPDPQRGTRRIELWRKGQNSQNPVLIGSVSQSPLDYSVTTQSLVLDAVSLQAYDCVYARAQHGDFFLGSEGEMISKQLILLPVKFAVTSSFYGPKKVRR